jgi:hypothetical protein
MASICAGPDTQLYVVTPENVGNYLAPGTLHENYRRLPQPALKADCVRAALLACHGGWWWDADTIGIQPVNGLMSEYRNADVLYMTWSRPPTRILNGYVYIRPGCGVGGRWLGRINAALADEFDAIAWTTLGEAMLSTLVQGQPRCHEIPRALFLPIDIDSHVASFFEPGDFRNYLRPDTVCFGLNHSWFVYHKERDIGLPPYVWAKSPLLIHQLLDSAQRALA